jgi:hypothetical protein
MRLVLDAGALIALERNDRAMWERLKLAVLSREAPISHAGVVGQVWRRGGPRQALLAKALEAIDVRHLDQALGRAAGELLARARRDDVIDAALVLLTRPGDRIVTSDPDDLAPLARAADLDIEIVRT